MSGLRRLYRVNEGATISGVSVDIELLIRLLEWAREEASSDVEIHLVAENIDALSDGGVPLGMDRYPEIMMGIGMQESD